MPSIWEISVETTLMPLVETRNHLPVERIPRKIACLAAILLIGIAHRLTTFLLHLSDLRTFVDQNPNWLTWQYPTTPALMDRLGLSLLRIHRNERSGPRPEHQQRPTQPPAVLISDSAGLPARVAGSLKTDFTRKCGRRLTSSKTLAK